MTTTDSCSEIVYHTLCVIVGDYCQTEVCNQVLFNLQLIGRLCLIRSRWFSVCKSVSSARWNVVFTSYEVEEAMTACEGERAGRALWVTGVSSVFILANQEIFCRNCKCESFGRMTRSRSGRFPVLSGWIWRDCPLFHLLSVVLVESVWFLCDYLFFFLRFSVLFFISLSFKCH